LELRQLRYFMAVAEELSFTRAAERLNLSQPPLSQQISSLEVELGAKLFVRTSRRVELSDCGKALLPHVEAIFGHVDEGRKHVRRVSEGMQGRIHIGLTGSHFLGPFPRFIRQFRESRPSVDLVLHELAPNEQLARLRSSKLDLCFERGAARSTDLESMLLWKDEAVVAMPHGHRFCARKLIQLHELADEDFVFLLKGSSTYERSVRDACIASGFEPLIVQQVLEVPAILNLVGAGLGISVVPASLARMRSDAVTSCRLASSPNRPAITADVHLIRRPEETRSMVLEFADALLTWSAEQVGVVDEKNN